jgi:predicted signal transduction protein with EAL and GGDEF domain
MDSTWIRNTFDWCVNILLSAADTIGVTYEALNVWVFVIIVPAVLVISLAVNIYFLWKSGQRETDFEEKDESFNQNSQYIKTLNI